MKTLFVTVTFLGLALAHPAPASAGCAGGGYAVGGVCCAYNVWAHSFVGTNASGNYVGDCNGGVRTPQQYNIGRGPND
jgi:hypothetical protein